MRTLSVIILALLLASGWLLLVGCSQDDEEEPAKKDDSVVIPLYVQNDDLFGFEIDRQFARVWLSDSRGPVGSPVRCQITIEDIDRFDENDLVVSMELTNPDSIKLDEFIVPYEFDSEKGEFKFIIPQILTVPTLLNFFLYVRVDDETSNDYFEGRGFYQFYVNTGTPAT